MASAVVPIITAVEQLIQYLLQLRANGQLADADLDALVANTNTETRTLIAQALGRPVPPITQ